MLFLEEDFSVKILSVQKLRWDFNNTFVKARPYNAISFRLKGNSDFSDGSGSVHLNYGDILFMPENVDYHLKSAEEEIIVIHFQLDGKKQDHFEVIHPKHISRYEALFENIYREWTKREQGYYFKSMAYFYTLFSMLSKHLPLVTDSAYLKIKKSVEHLNQSFTDADLSVSVLAAISGMSDTYFRKIFFEVFNTTPLKFINELRVDYAVELLETGYYSVESISEKCGFADPKYFSTVFKRYKGCSPSEYKKTFHNQKERLQK